MVATGSSADIIIRPKGDLAAVKTVTAINEMVRRGVSTREAMRAIDLMVSTGRALVSVPKVDVLFAGTMKRAGIRVSRPRQLEQANVREIRERLRLSTSDFAKRFGFEQRTVEGWEQGRTIPSSANVVLHVIASDPQVVEKVLEAPLD